MKLIGRWRTWGLVTVCVYRRDVQVTVLRGQPVRALPPSEAELTERTES